LLAEGHEVIAVDDLSTGSRANVAHLTGNDAFTLFEHDVTRPFDVEADWFFNLASPASPVHYQADPIHTTMTNVLGAFHVLELAERCGGRVFQASTSEIYGDPEVHPQPESYWGNVNTVGPRSCYDEGKRCAETLTMDFYRSRGVDVRVVRIFNTYGPRMAFDDGRVVSNFIVQALRGEDITIYGDGAQTRSFCYVDDLLDGFLRLMRHPSETGPVNLGNPGEFTVRELAEQIIELTGSGSTVVRRPLPVDDPKRRKPDISRAKAALGFEPRTPLRAGLEKTIAYFREALTTPRRSTRVVRSERGVSLPRGSRPRIAVHQSRGS
jgi:UDP-glucuronate decarboxylase